MDSRVRPANETTAEDGAAVKKIKLSSSTALVVVNEAEHQQEASARQVCLLTCVAAVFADVCIMYRQWLLADAPLLWAPAWL